MSIFYSIVKLMVCAEYSCPHQTSISISDILVRRLVKTILSELEDGI